MSDVVAAADILTAVSSALAGISGIQRVQGYNELTEGMNDTPTIQIYLEEYEYDASTNNDRRSFSAGLRVEEFLIYIDIYGRQRSQLAEDMEAAVVALDLVRARLLAIQTYPFFPTVPQVKSMKLLRARRVNFTYGDPKVSYLGYQLPLQLRTW